MLSVFVGGAVAAYIFEALGMTPIAWYEHIVLGGFCFGAVFMATDYATSPMTHKGQMVYGVGIGLLTIVIRNWGAYPEGMSFAILIMNAFTPLINVYMKPKRFGEKIVKKA